MAKPKKQTLRSFLSKDRLLEMAGEKVYARGENYYERGLVDMLFHEPYKAAAEVRGSNPYRVDLGLSDEGKLIADCTCPAMNNWGFCKHAVSVALAVMNTPAIAGSGKNFHEPEKDTFAEKYPNLAGWIGDGTIEIGRDGYTTSMIRVIDEGGIVYEGGTRHKSIDKMLEEAENAVKEWVGEDYW